MIPRRPQQQLPEQKKKGKGRRALEVGGAAGAGVLATTGVGATVGRAVGGRIGQRTALEAAEKKINGPVRIGSREAMLKDRVLKTAGKQQSVPYAKIKVTNKRSVNLTAKESITNAMTRRNALRDNWTGRTRGGLEERYKNVSARAGKKAGQKAGTAIGARAGKALGVGGLAITGATLIANKLKQKFGGEK